MARARNIKPALFKNEVLGVADMALTVLFAGLWTLADRDGRLEDRPLRIKAEIFPYREKLDINGYLTELASLGFIDRYVVNGVSIIQVLTFSVHQNPHKTEKASELPAKPIPEPSKEIHVKAPLNNGAITEAARLIPDSLNTDSLVLIPDSLSSDSVATMSLDAPADFLKHLISRHGYDERPVRTKTQNMQQARQWFDDGVTLQELDDAVEVSRARLAGNDDERDPPVAYLAKVLASNRKQGQPVKTAGINTHGGFTADRYQIDPIARKFQIVGGDA